MNVDTLDRYGTISRLFHWGMACLFIFQFLAALAHYGFEDTAFEALVWPLHKPLGVVLLILLLARAAWAVLHLKQRPSSHSVQSKIGHVALYVLMLVIPTLALIRQYGSGKPFELFGFSLMPGFEGGKIEWMVHLGSLLHGELGWVLLLLIVGQITMVRIHHRKNANQSVLPRMWR